MSAEFNVRCMSEVVRKLDPATLARIGSHSHTLRISLEGSGLNLMDAPHSVELMDQVWEKLVEYPVPPDTHEWLVTAFAALLAEQLAALYSFRWKELVDVHGASPCLVENRTGVRVFPFDSVLRRLQSEERVFFGPYLAQIERVMKEHGLSPRNAPSAASSNIHVTAVPAPEASSAPAQKPWWKVW